MVPQADKTISKLKVVLNVKGESGMRSAAQAVSRRNIDSIGKRESDIEVDNRFDW